MRQNANIQLTAAEIGTLWYQYMSDSMALQVLTVFCQQVEDKEIRPIIEYAKGLSRNICRKFRKFSAAKMSRFPTVLQMRI